MSDIILGVDGTGPEDNTEYKSAFANSFVRSYCNDQAGFAFRNYWRGPALMGSETGMLADYTARLARAVYQLLQDRTPAPRIFLTGFSRGGAAVIDAAHRLADHDIPVHCLLLFDAVDRSTKVGDRVDTIPSNVVTCYHALRHPDADSRFYFGNCGTQWKAPTRYVSERFHCTHGAMGGTPNTQFSDDGYAQEDLGGSGGKVAAFAAGGLLGLHAHNEAAKTNVKQHQEKSEGARVRKWMDANLTLAKSHVG